MQSSSWSAARAAWHDCTHFYDDAVQQPSICSRAGNAAADMTDYKLQGQGGKPQLLSANAGDARVILARGGKGMQLSEDHTPDV